ncbi:TPA: phage tail protein [Escherichia coli]|nr:phage tail protein [Escherichia coli]
MSALLTKAFEKWVAECTASNLPARPDTIIFALMEREPTREDNTVPEEKITYAVNELTYGQLSPNNIVCSAVVPDDCAFNYDWICLIHQPSGTLCGIIKTPVRQKHVGESLVRNFTITYQGVAQAAQITVPPQSWQVDISPELKSMLKIPNRLSEIAAEGKEAQQESRDNLGLKSAATMEPQNDTHDRTPGRLAVPGMFGFGKIFSPDDVVRFNSEADLLRWAKQVTPGEYFVNGSSGILPGVVFQGMIRIRFLEADRATPNPPYTAKAIIFYGVNGDIYYNRYWSTGDGWLTGWINLKVNEASLRALIETRAPLNSPALTGTPSTPTPPDDAAGNEIANAEFVRKLLAALVDSSPEALDTLNELAAALGNDPNFATTITNALAGKQPLNYVLTAVSKITPEENTLPYFSADGRILLAQLSEKARSLLAQATAEDMRKVLELKDSGTVTLQSDIYDRSEGRGALPGALGFGALTSTIKYFSASDGQSELVTWCMQTPPGRYLVEQRTHPDFNPIIPDIGFTGVLEIKISDRVYSQAEHQGKRKLLTFYGQYGDVYRTVLDANPTNPSLRPWDSGYINRSGIASLLGSDSQAPEVGNIILAAYYGTSDSDMTRTLQRGKIYPGSRLGYVEFSGGVATGAGVKGITPTCYVSGRSYSLSLPGAYRALSGSGGVLMGDNNTIVGLFVRVR